MRWLTPIRRAVASPADRPVVPAWAAAGCLLLATAAGLPAARCCAAGEPAAAAQPESRVPPPVPLSRPPATGTPAAPAARHASNWPVVGLIAVAFAAVVAVRLLAARRDSALPPDVFEVLGAGSLGGQHAVRVVRFGPKTLLVSLSSAGCQTLSELEDPQATECIAAACRGVHPPLRPVRGPRGAAPAPSRPAIARPAGQEVA